MPFWTGDPGRGTGVFAELNCAAPGSITTVSDPTLGSAWRYTKPAGDKRCESHGIAVHGQKYNFQDNATYYLGWWVRLSTIADDNANFQWKSYGTGMTQDYPFVISVLGGRFSMWQRQPGTSGSTVWQSAPISANTWYHFVVGIHTSDAVAGGWVQVWLGGTQQNFTNGARQYACRTRDVSDDPKWGVYGAQGTDFSAFVAAPRVGLSYSAVAN